MCGIAGFCDFKRNLLQEKICNTNILKKMHSCLSHRGSDNFGVYLSKIAGLSHARLSIRDINGGNQPMIKKIHDKEYAICYNGEIYNCNELKSRLEKKGYEFVTTSDTEVVLYSYMVPLLLHN